MRYYIGIDPDLHHAGLVLLGPTVCYYAVARIPSKHKGERANVLMSEHVHEGLKDLLARAPLVPQVIVESQAIRPGSNVNPQDIVMLAQAAGIAAGIAASLVGCENVTLVQPHEWKGSAKKEHCTDMLRQHFSAGGLGVHESHILDAAGLAAWGWIRDQLPRAPDRDPDAPISGVCLNQQRLSSLPRLRLGVVPKQG